MNPRHVSLSVALLSCLWVTAPAAAQGWMTDPGAKPAQTVKSVIELFTSQGCSSCPDADALLQKYADAEDLVALSFPVDYWDYLGWKDTLASPKNAERQRAYAKRRGDGAVYTPQVVVNGISHAVGSSQEEIDRAIVLTKARFAASRVPVRLWHDQKNLIIETGDAPANAEHRQHTIWLAVVQRSANVAIKRGENSGKTVTYVNVVRELTHVGTFTGRAEIIRLARQAVEKPGTERLAVLIQEETGGPIIGAAWMGM